MHKAWVLIVVALGAACGQQPADGETGAAVAAPRAAAAGGGAAGGAGRAARARGLPEHALRLQPAVIIDANGFERPMGAITLFIPHGWHTQGGVEWGPQYLCTNGYAFNWMASAPDGSASITLLPQTGWSMSNYGAAGGSPGCPAAPYTSVRAYIEALLQRWRPGARPLDYRVRDDLQAEFARLNSRTPVAGGEMRTWVEAGELLFALEAGGRELRGTLAAAVIFSGSRVDYGMGAMESISAQALPAWGVTAPNGRLDFGYFEAIRRSIRPNPRWEQLIAGHNRRIGQVALQESRKQAGIIADSNAEIARIRQESWNASQESADRRARQFSEALRGVQSYDDAKAAGGTVELSNLYSNAWRLNDGSYVLTNDASFDPYRDLQVEGQRLEVTRGGY